MLPDGTKPLPESMLTYYQKCLMTVISGQFHKGCLSHQLLKLAWKLLISNFISNLPGGNVLMHLGLKGTGVGGRHPVGFYVHYSDVIMSMMASQITSLTSVYSTIYSGADQRTHQNSASLAFVRGIHRWPVNSPHKWPVTRKMFPFDDVIM